MTDDRSLERAARSFIEPGPTRAPEAALERSLLLIQTIPQERDLRIPLRFQTMTTPARVAAAAVIGVLAIGGASFILGRSGESSDVGGPTPSAPQPIASTDRSPSASPSSSAGALDYSTVGGRILMEHLGNAPDGSEMPTSDYHPERRRLYWMDPATMTGATAVEFLPGQPATGKMNADVSRDGRQVVFMDTANPADVWIANTDGTGLRNLSGACTCSELDPAFDPTGTKVAFVHVEGAIRESLQGASLGFQWDGRTPVNSWLAIRDLATGKVTKLGATSLTGPDGLPYQPAWSPDGKSIAFNRITWQTGGDPTGSLQVVDVATGGVRTVLTTPAATAPGDAAWSPDSSTIVFTNFPISAMGSIDGISRDIFTVGSDGSNLKRLTRTGAAAATYLPDGRLLFQYNYFWIMNADGTDPRPVKFRGDDLTELNVGFAYIPHWVAAP